jgi:hypothetical protein
MSIIESHAVGAESRSARIPTVARQRDDNVPGGFRGGLPEIDSERRSSTSWGDPGLIGGGIAAGTIFMMVLPRVAFACIFPMMPAIALPDVNAIAGTLIQIAVLRQSKCCWRDEVSDV